MIQEAENSLIIGIQQQNDPINQFIFDFDPLSSDRYWVTEVIARRDPTFSTYPRTYFELPPDQHTTNPLISFNQSPSQKKQLNAHHHNGINLIPVELLYEILEYYTNTFQGLMTFAIVCSEWKKISDHSLVWLKCDLTFYTPIQFIKANFSNTENAIELNRFQTTRTFMETSHLAYQFRDECRRITLFDEIDPQDHLFIYCFTIYIYRNVYNPSNNSIKCINPNINPYITAYTIRTWFFRVLRYCLKLWYKEIKWIQRLQYFNRFEQLFEKSIYGVFIQGVVGIIALTCSMYFLNNYSNHYSNQQQHEDHHLSHQIDLHLGFLGLYIVYSLIFIHSLAHSLLEYLYYTTFLDYLSYIQNRKIALIYAGDNITCMMLSILVATVLLHVKISTSSSSLLYVESGIFLWFPVICSLIQGIYAQKRYKVFTLGYRKSNLSTFIKAVILQGLIALSCTLLGIYFDDAKSHGGIDRIGYAIIPMLPVFLVIIMFVFMVNVVAGYLYYDVLWQNYIGRNVFSSRLLTVISILTATTITLFSSWFVLYWIVSLLIVSFDENQRTWDQDWWGIGEISGIGRVLMCFLSLTILCLMIYIEGNVFVL